jgi:hypothetical protein
MRSIAEAVVAEVVTHLIQSALAKRTKVVEALSQLIPSGDQLAPVQPLGPERSGPAVQSAAAKRAKALLVAKLIQSVVKEMVVVVAALPKKDMLGR